MVDLLLLHHAGRVQGDPRAPPACFDEAAAGPAGNGTFYTCRMEAWGALKALKAAGKARAIGVSNWDIRDLQQLFDRYGEYPAVNQIEVHPYYHTESAPLRAFCKEKGIAVTAYAPMANYPARSTLLADPALKAVAAAHGVTAADVALKFEFHVGADTAIPRSQSPAHQLDNLHFFDKEWALTEAEVARLSALPQKKVYDTQCQPWC